MGLHRCIRQPGTKTTDYLYRDDGRTIKMKYERWPQYDRRAEDNSICLGRNIRIHNARLVLLANFTIPTQNNIVYTQN